MSRMLTNDLCNVRGYIDSGRITAIRGREVTVEMAEGLLTVDASDITRSWAPVVYSIGDYMPMTSDLEIPPED